MVFSHVLISRPEPEAVELAGLLKGTPLVPVLLPAFAFEPGFAGLDLGRVWSEGKRRLAIFCSPRAVDFGLRQLPAGFLDDVEIAAIGPATSNALESAGYTVTILPVGEFNSESLLAHPALSSAPGSALVFAAPGGRQALFAGLTERGWDTDFAHVYRSVPVEPEPGVVESLPTGRNILSVWTSANALARHAKNLDPQVWERICEGDFLVTSARLAEIAQSHAPGRVHVTDEPGNIAIRDCILGLI